MDKEVVRVEKVIGDKVRVQFERKVSCSCCRLESVCAQRKGNFDIERRGFSLKAGDKVEVAIDGNKGLLAVVLTFFFPAAVFMASVIIFQDKGELISFFIALVIVCLYYLILKLIVKRFKNKFELKILKKL
ncbi:MAG: SoxR reducing system RseC family protein [Candidatus Omnitrophica bacterium]|nr:SoxR reducing system RseC family protein [Candidatus Omnitrophota bacterium]